MHYEYETEDTGPLESGMDVLKRRGAEGWVLCAVLDTVYYRSYYFMRPYTKPVE